MQKRNVLSALCAAAVLTLAPAGAWAEAMDDADFVLLISRGGTAAQVKQALADGANPNAGIGVRGSDEMDTALCSAATLDNTEVLRLLLAAGAKVNTVAWAGRTALMYARSAAAVRMLVEAGTNLDVQDEDGETALMTAVRGESAESAKVLLAAGANPRLKDKKGHDALWHARHSDWLKDDAELIRLLEGGSTKKPAAQDAGAFSAADLKRMSTFVSNFVEAHFPDFDAQKGDAPSNPALIRFGIWHNYINNFKSRVKIKDCQVEDCERGSMVIEAKSVAESVKKYFDLGVQHRSSPGDDDGISFHLDGSRYHFGLGDGDPIPFAKVKRAVREGGIIRMTGDIYSEDNSGDPPEIIATFTVTAKPHKWNGKDTWAILSLKTEYR